MELGVSEEQANRLADDANMDAIKRMTVDQVAKKVAGWCGEVRRGTRRRRSA